MDWKNIQISPDYIIDIVIYLVVAVALIVVSKWVWEYREKRKLQKEFAEYQLRKEEEAQEQ